MKSVFAFAFSLFLTVAASAQNYVYQSGGVTPNHAVRWITNGVIGDGGTAANGFLSSIGVLAQGPAICQQSAAPPSPYNQLCLGVNTAGAATISLQNYGGASPQNLNFVINGVTYPFPQSLNSLVIGGTAIINCSTNGYGLYNNNGILGCEPITASPGGSNTDLQYNSSGSFGGISGATSDGTNVTFGAANLRVLGSSTGYNTLETANAGTSNYVTTFPAATDTVVELAQTQTLTNKTIASLTDVLGGVTLTLGSDATGDIYYRNSGGVLTRLGIGSTGNVLTVSGGLPAWESNTVVTTFSAGTTGFTPNSATTGAVTLAGTLAVANGGTGAAISATQYGLPYFISTTAMGSTGAGTSSGVLQGNASGAPTWVTTLSNTLQGNITTVGTIGTGVWQGTAPGLAYGGTNANLTANAGGIVYSTVSALAILNNPNSNGECLLSGTSAPTWGSCSGTTGVASLGNASADTSLTIAGTGSGPWTGTVTVQLNLGNAQTWTAAQTFTNGDLILAGSSSGSSALETSATGGGTITFQAGAHTVASITLADQTLSGGANVTSNNIGTVSSGTTTVDCGTRPLQYLTNGGAFTLAAPSNDGACDIQITNNGSAGAVTFSGFTVNSAFTGGTLTTTNTNKFFVHIERINGSSTYIVIPQQ